MRFPRSTKVFRGQLEAAPFLGLFFLMVMFLLLKTSFVFTPGVPIQLPAAAELPGAANPTVIVAIDKDGYYYFENQMTDENQLKERLRASVVQATEPLTLIIEADGQARYERVLQLQLLARDTGIKKVHQATRPKNPLITIREKS
jgi:biopolymer transport protein ExbD